MRQIVASLAVVVVLFGLAGCSKNPGALGKSDIEAELREELKLKDVSLTANPDGGYTGTGKLADGTKYTLIVTQDEKDKKLSYTLKNEEGRVVRGGYIKNY